MPLSLTTPPTSEPLTLQQAKLYLRVDSTEEDSLITALITGARERAEIETQRQLMPATYVFSVGDDWGAQKPAYDPANNRITLPKPPLRSVTSVKYMDASGIENPMDPSEYRVVTGEEPGYIVLNTIPPYDPNREDAIRITYVAGYADAASVPGGILQAIKWIMGEAYGTRTEHEAPMESSILKLLRLYKVWKW